MGFRESKIDPLQFTVSSTLDHAEIKQLADLAAEQSARMLTSSIKPSRTTPSLLEYAVKGPGGIMTLMVFGLHLAAADGATQVRLEVGDFTTSRPALLGLIPIGPKTAPALGSLTRFVGFIRPKLQGRP